MSTEPETPDLVTRDTDLNRYLHALAGGENDALLGWLVIYNITGVEPVGQDELRNWFEELELDTKYLPGKPRALDAFEKATSAAKATYPLGVRKRNHASKGQTVTLMMRAVMRDETRIARHLVRELADHDNEALSYEVCLAEAQFQRDLTPNAPEGAGQMLLVPDEEEIHRLGAEERTTITALLDQIDSDYRNRSRYVGADRLRKILRDYCEDDLGAVRIHNGVYFVHHRHARLLAALRELASRFGGEVTRIPLPNAAEMRQMVDGAFESKAQADLESLVRDIARAAGDPKPWQVRKLDGRYRAVLEAAQDYQETLGTHLTRVEATLDLVQAQMASLWIAVGEKAADAALGNQPEQR
ncbi:hypothetical protein GCM10010174_88370 [Kutzneria viridogrisea]|uniref:Uncharacterized protein n=1 Tax=Kutzneria viridogrisea TaxID=47990 RepID=A0ABR6BZ64_9PSEU|nr:hypothetical protein [Kutzneria viridogrisea]